MNNQQIIERMKLVAEIVDKKLPFEVKGKNRGDWYSPYGSEKVNDCDGYKIAAIYYLCNFDLQLRIQAPKKEIKVLFGRDDIPVGSFIRVTDTNTWEIIAYLGECGLIDCMGDLITWKCYRKITKLSVPAKIGNLVTKSKMNKLILFLPILLLSCVAPNAKEGFRVTTYKADGEIAAQYEIKDYDVGENGIYIMVGGAKKKISGSYKIEKFVK